jgi:hypothetical protein
MNRTTSLIIALSVLVLGGAWLASRALTADVAPPPMTGVVAPAPVVVAPPPEAPVRRAEPEPVAVAPTPEAPVAPPPMHEAAPVVRAPPEPYVKPPHVAPPPPDPDQSETEQESTALAEDAWRLMTAPDTGPANWQRAAKSFRRCLAMTPDNERCKAGIEAVTKKIGVLPPPTGPKVRLPHPSAADEE